VPFVIHAAGQTAAIKTDSLTESLDMYPTVAALAGLAPPPNVDGTDLSPVWKAPKTALKTVLKDRYCESLKFSFALVLILKVSAQVAFSEYPRCAPLDAAWTPEPGYTTPQSCVNTARTNFTFMGYSVRTDEWRATFWMPWDKVNLFLWPACCARRPRRSAARRSR